MASEEMSFENVDEGTDDGQTDACLYNKLTYELKGELHKSCRS